MNGNSGFNSQDVNKPSQELCTQEVPESQMTQQVPNADAGDSAQKARKTWGRLIGLEKDIPVIDLEKASYLIGRHSSCDFQLSEVSFSNRHFQIYQDKEDGSSRLNGGRGGPVFLKDLSTNGTYVNGKKIGKMNSVLLQSNDEISLPTKKRKLFMFQEGPGSETDNGLAEEETGIHSKYYITKLLGAGNFAEVKLAICKNTGKQYAVKIIDRKKLFMNKTLQDSLNHEVSILKSVCHPSVTAIHEVFETDKTLYIVLELVRGGELFDKIIQDGHFSEKQSKFLFYQMLVAVKYLHDKGITHRDLKPENVLLSNKELDSCIVKITDFGLSKLVGENSFMKTVCGTPSYLAPEVVSIAGRNKGSYDKAVDCWSLGVILYICLCGVPPFDEGSESSLLEQISNGLYDFNNGDWTNISSDAKELVSLLLTVDPKKRATVNDALKHRWMAHKWLPKKYEEVLKQSGEKVPLFVANAVHSEPILSMGPPALPPSCQKSVKRPPPQPAITKPARSPFLELNRNKHTPEPTAKAGFAHPERKRLSAEFIDDKNEGTETMAKKVQKLNE
eukprot:Nk52_evm23s78 gene=Nk52_evmTU23s78